MEIWKPGFDVAKVVEMTIQNLLPTIVQTIKVAAEKSCETKITGLQDELHAVKQLLGRNRVLQKISNDRLEQYLRNENIRIHGMKEKEEQKEDDLISQVQELGIAIGMNMNSAAQTGGQKEEVEPDLSFSLQ